jgi:lactoylglutathione lyase
MSLPTEEVLAESEKPERRYAFLGRDGNLVLTLWQQSAGAFDAAARLADLGVPLIYDEILPHMPGMSSGGIFFADPDGTRVEVCTASGLDTLPALEHGEPSCGFF